MCGILGYINLSNSKGVPEAQLAASLETIKYRGPDYTGKKCFRGTNGQLKVYLGHQRLSIIDLSSASHQPFSLEEEYHIIFNGEIYNYLEIKQDLISKGYTFKTDSDTEVLLMLYKESGTQRFGELNGMWAFMIYDKVKQVVVVSRDRFGIKPVYVLHQDNQLFFASEIKQLLSFSTAKTPNEALLANYLYAYAIDYNNESCFKEINKLPPSSNLCVDIKTGTTTTETFWKFTKKDLSQATTEELQGQYRELLENSIQLRMRSDVKVGNTLSGGLDSSSIAVLAHRLSGGNIYNYSIVSDNPDVSEEKYVDALIRENNINVKKINFDQTDPWGILDKVIHHHDEPILSLSTVAHYTMMETLKNQSDIIVVLSGQGGDESLAGYNKYFFFNIKDLIRQGNYAQAAIELASIAPRLGGEFQLKHAKRYLPFLKKMGGNLNSFDEMIALDKTNLPIGSSNTLRDRQISDIQHFSVPALCHYEDRNSMAHSLEIRLPFLDYRLVEFSVSLPNQMKIHKGVNKQILRQSIKELPNVISKRFDKKGFNVDEAKHNTERFFEVFRGNFKESALADLKLIHKDVVDQKFHDLEAGKSPIWERDWHRLLFAEIWAKKLL